MSAHFVEMSERNQIVLLALLEALAVGFEGMYDLVQEKILGICFRVSLILGTRIGFEQNVTKSEIFIKYILNLLFLVKNSRLELTRCRRVFLWDC